MDKLLFAGCVKQVFPFIFPPVFQQKMFIMLAQYSFLNDVRLTHKEVSHTAIPFYYSAIRLMVHPLYQSTRSIEPISQLHHCLGVNH